MAISRVKLNWAVNEKLTSGQQNALDLNVTNALDKRAAQTDTLSSVITVASGGAIAFASGSTLSTVSGVTTTLNGDVTVNGIFNANGIVNCGSDLNVLGSLTVSSVSSFAAQVTFSSNVILSGSVSASGAITSIGSNFWFGDNAFTGATSASDLTVTGSNKLKLTSRTITRTVCANFTPISTGWTFNSDPLGTPRTTTTSNENGCWPLSLPEGAVINTIQLVVEGGAGHAGAPSNLPLVSLFYKTPGTGSTGTLISTRTDVFSSAAAYEQPHFLSMTSIAYTVTRTARLSIYFQSESSTNATSGYKIHGINVTYTITSVDDGPCS